MTEAVMGFIELYMPELIGGGFAVGGFMGALACLAGYGIKQALSFFDR